MSVTLLNSERFSHYCPCPTVRDWFAVYPALSVFLLAIFCFSPCWLLFFLLLSFVSVFAIFAFLLAIFCFSNWLLFLFLTAVVSISYRCFLFLCFLFFSMLSSVHHCHLLLIVFRRDVEAIDRFHFGGWDSYLNLNCKMEAEAVEAA